MKNYDRLSILISLVLLGLIMTQLISLPTRIVEATVFGSPVTLVLSTETIIGLLLGLLTATGVEYIMRAHPMIDERRSGPLVGLWVLPMLVTLAAARLTPMLLGRGIGTWVVGLVIAGIVLAAVVVVQYRAIDPRAPGALSARLLSNALSYGAAFLLFAMLYGAKLRSLLSASIMVVLAGLLALSILRGYTKEQHSSWYALLVGLLMGQTTWALNYWGVNGLKGGALLLLLFYLLTGLAQQRLLDRFNRRVLLEYGLVTIVGIALLAIRGPFSW